MEKVEGIQYWVVVEFCFSHSHNLSEMNNSVKLVMESLQRNAYKGLKNRPCRAEDLE